MSFLYPAFLLGTLAAAVPVVIHLIYRRRALVHRFPAVRFLLLADKRTARKFRVQQWLLLALRVLAILLLAFVLARPRLLGGGVQAAAALPAQATVILVDNSLSMQYRDAQETRLQRAKTLAMRFLQGLRLQDSAVILPLITQDQSTAPAFFARETETFQEQLAAIQPSQATVDLLGALQRAFALLQDAGARRRLILLSDFTVHGWEDFHLARLPMVPEQVELSFVRLGGAQRDGNILVEGIRIVEKPFIEHTPLEVTVLVRNRSATAVRNLRVDLLIEQSKSGEQLVDLGPDELVAVPFRLLAPAAGLHWGEVHLESDRFAEDDRFYYAMRTVAPVRVLVVDGDPGTSLFESEVFYLLSALQPSGALRRPLFYPKPVTWEGLGNERLTDYQVIVLSNVEALEPQVIQRLYQFVMDGGGLLFFAGNRVEATRYNAMLYRSEMLLLPLALGQPLQHPQEQPMTLGTVDSTHEALTVFMGESPLLQRGKFYRYLTVEGLQETPSARALLTFQDGNPLLVEKGLGRGRVLFFTSSADRDWTDLPTRTAYVPLLHGMLGYAANLAAATQRPGVEMPAPATLPGRATDAGAAVTLVTPDGQERGSRYAAEGTQVVAHFAEYTLPGIYRLATPGGPDVLAVNATRAESNFEKLQSADLRARFQPLQLLLAEEEQLDQANLGNLLPFKELSAIFMIALVAVLMVENVCANRF
ncbi:MAG TPA: BatA domain-containing protein [Candidatus Tectomicrobia bacterium]